MNLDVGAQGMITSDTKPDTRCDLIIYVIYQNPSDFPGKFVLRRWVGLNPDQKPAVCMTLAEARRAVPPNKYRLPRFDNDDPVIVETWL